MPAANLNAVNTAAHIAEDIKRSELINRMFGSALRAFEEYCEKADDAEAALMTMLRDRGLGEGAYIKTGRGALYKVREVVVRSNIDSQEGPVGVFYYMTAARVLATTEEGSIKTGGTERFRSDGDWFVTSKDDLAELPVLPRKGNRHA